jgi:hypothetical protein
VSRDEISRLSLGLGWQIDMQSQAELGWAGLGWAASQAKI